jgi:hypothetical protein
MYRRFTRLGALLAADAGVLVLARPALADVWRHLRHPTAWVDTAGTDAALGTVAAALLWLAAAWLAAGLLALLAGELPGATGRIGTALSRRLLPRALAAGIAGAAGLGVLLAPVATAAPPPPPPGTSTPALPAPTWPVGPTSPGAGQLHVRQSNATTPARHRPPASTPLPARTRPSASAPAQGGPSREPGRSPTQPPQPPERTTPPAHRAQPVSRPQHTADQSAVQVRRGDSLWLIAARRLGAHPRPAEIAASWPRWYAANRAVIGTDPDLILPGQVLTEPADLPSEEASR